jgi:hypothetical protein
MDGGSGVLSFIAGPPSDERVECVGHEGMAMHHCGKEEKALEQPRFMGSDNTSK